MGGELLGDFAEAAPVTSKISGKFRWTAAKTRNKSLRACKNSVKFGIVLKKLGQVPGAPSIGSPRTLSFDFSLAVAGHIAFFFCPQVRLIGSAREAQEPAGRRRQQCVRSLMWPSAWSTLRRAEQLVLGVLQALRFVQLAKMVKQFSQKGQMPQGASGAKVSYRSS